MPGKLLITKNISCEIAKCTNERAKSKDIDLNLSCSELEKFIGLVYLRGVLAMRKTPIKFIWSHEFGMPYFKQKMVRNRFEQIMKNLRFEINFEKTLGRSRQRFR